MLLHFSREFCENKSAGSVDGVDVAVVVTECGKLRRIVENIFQLDDPTRRDKLLSINFRLMEEALKFLSGLKENQRMDSNWNAIVSALVHRKVDRLHRSLPRQHLEMPKLS